MSKQQIIQIESRNAILELLREGRTFDRIYVATGSYKDPKAVEIVALASQKHIPIIKVARKTLSKRLRASSSESMVGIMFSDNDWELDVLLDKIYEEKKLPFFLILDNIKYKQNIAAIMRTAFAVGVNGIVVPPSNEPIINDEVIRISMGAAERIPLVQMNLFSAIKELKENAVRIIASDMDGKIIYESDLKGSVAIILGAEDVGISTGLLERADDTVSIPMREGIGSLNVSVSAGVLMYEKLRQEVS